MTRAKWKGPYLDKNLVKSFKNTLKPKHFIKTSSRESVIVPKLIGKVINVHNGKFFLKITVTEEMLGHKLGEFSPTRKKFIFKKK